MQGLAPPARPLRAQAPRSHAVLSIINRFVVVLFALSAANLGGNRARTWSAQEHPLREFTVTARACSFTPTQIRIDLGDRVRMTFVAEDAPHAFVIAAYRISRRTTPHRKATFEFLADQPGTFVFLSDLASDADCPDMRGELVVVDRSR